MFFSGGILFSFYCVSEFEFVYLMGGIFFQFGGNWGQMGAKVLVEFEKKNSNWGHFFSQLGAIRGNWGQMC